MERKTPEETSQNDREKTRESTTHTHLHSIYDYDNPRRRRKWQPIPQETSSSLDKLRLEYRDKVIEKRSFESSIWGYCEYDVYPDEYYEKELEILCGDMDPEQAANYLELVSLYSHALLKRLDTVRAFQYLKALGSDRPETREYAKRVIAENPGTPIELEARFYIADVVLPVTGSLAERAQAYREILDIVPNSTEALDRLGFTLINDDKPAEAIPYLKKLNRLDPGAGNYSLGESYEKLGDVKTAWTYYKKALRGRAYHSPIATGSRLHIEAIEAGDPIYKPVVQDPHTSVSSFSSHEHTIEHHGPQEHKHHAEVSPDDPPWTDPESTSPKDTRSDNDERRRTAAAAAQQAHDDFLKHQERSQKGFDDFLQWAETIMNADSPMDTNDFLMQEMEAHLKGGQAQFDPDRIVRAFETMERYGPAEGIKRLQKADSDLAKQVQRLSTHNKTQHVHLHTHGDQHCEQPHLTTDVADQRNLLRQYYKDKGLVRTWGTSKLSVGWGVYPDEYYETELELLCGDMDPEQAANQLSALGIHNRALLKRLDSVRAFQYLRSLDFGNPPLCVVPDVSEYAERVIAENPGTSIEIEARFYIAEIIPWRKEFFEEKAKAYQAVLDIDPNAINALAQLGSVLFQDDKPAEAIQYFKQVNNLNPGAGHVGLGWAYEKLGDVKTAWVYYKKALANGYLDPDLLKRHIKQIEVGDPIYKPISQETYVSVSDERRRAAAQQAHDDFLKHQERSQKELNDFLQWAETIMNADSPMDTNDFLMQEMEAHLKGGQAQFEPDRIVRAFETMERYGSAEGIKHLQKSDPNVAAAVLQQLNEKRPPQSEK